MEFQLKPPLRVEFYVKLPLRVEFILKLSPRGSFIFITHSSYLCAKKLQGEI
jgi:hypothetical protein